MSVEPYSNRELDTKFETVHEKLDSILEQVTYTNGKVRKIVIALIGIGFFSLGLGIANASPLLSFLMTL